MTKYSVVPAGLDPVFMHNDETFRTYVQANVSLATLQGNEFACTVWGYSCVARPYMKLNDTNSLLVISMYQDLSTPGIYGPGDVTITLTINTGQTTNIVVPSPFIYNYSRTLKSDRYILSNNTGQSMYTFDFALISLSSTLTDYFYLPPNSYGGNERRSTKPVLGSPNQYTTSIMLGWSMSNRETILYESFGNGNTVGSFTIAMNTQQPAKVLLTTYASSDTSFFSFKGEFSLDWYSECHYDLSQGINYDDMIYPFGVRSLIEPSVQMSMTFLASTYMWYSPSQATIMCGNAQAQQFEFIYGLNFTDVQAPEVLNIAFQKINETTYHIHAEITDFLSGFFQMTLFLSTGDYLVINKNNLVVGDAKHGYYQQLFMVRSSWDDRMYSIISIMDNTHNVMNIDNGGDYVGNSVPARALTSMWEVDIDDITDFHFDKYVMDVSTSSMNNTLYFRSTKINRNFIISFTYGHPEENPFYQSFGGYDVILGQFVIPFTVPARTYTRELEYYIKIQPTNINGYSNSLKLGPWVTMGVSIIDCAVLKARFTSAAVVNVTSTNADEFPPMVRYISAFPGTSIMPSADMTTIGWNLTIEDQLNGFERGHINVSNSADGSVRQFNFKLSDRLPGSNATIGVYVIGFQVSRYSKRSSYTIRDMQLIDSSGNTATFTKGTGQVTMTISPMTYFERNDFTPYTIQFNSNPIDTDPPNLTDLKVVTPTVNVGSFNRFVRVRFSINETGGYDFTKMPCVYLTGQVFELIKLTTSYFGVENGTNQLLFDAWVTLPYGFGATHGKVLISIYGLVDTSSNYNGYSTRNIIDLGLGNAPEIKVNFDHIFPIIENIALSNGTITVYGRNFGLDPTLVQGFINYTSGGVPFSTPKASFHTGIMMVFPFQPTNTTMALFIQVSQTTVMSNQYYFNVGSPPVTPTPTPPLTLTPTPGTPNTTITCPDGCSNGGVCSPTVGCVCTPSWYGERCESQTIPTSPTVLPNTPTTVFTFNGTAGLLMGDINVVKVRELDNGGAEVVTHDLTQWNMSMSSPLLTEYRTLFANDTGAIKVSILWFNVSKDITFAGDNITMPESTIKYTIEVERYTFKSKLNSMQVIMAAAINTTDLSSCSTHEYGYVEGATKPSVYWMRVKVAKFSLYGRFIQKALVDGRVAVVTNTLFNDSLQVPDSHISQTMIAINSQHFDKNVIMDPDFHLLIDTTDAKDSRSDRTCPGGNGTKLSALAIAGIVVLCVAFVAAIVVAVWMRRRVQKRHRIEVNRLEKRMSELKEKK
ncbi:hypothetical protein SAMD00019534_057830 [Acytostelium subglobosum LB1]|uniref:hypothetical protein n=1 Tax=Acytostelium subglobosum LB1 TaxID=1410327 RepID=UPI000644A434|nr:hypothetical protein SAMD00019534_057830 [Acytostelium subglobosum LB1]GAM22608.1 hypothetical protein SAMD00019534_057830 [Acytostelium subglobosum LB1]|eukprot:XP_012754728.1 hypothetical protein SAMD00019534_057830 [Acytostelium subglobosum LB1]